MKKPFFKKFLSNFREIILEETGSEHNPVLQIILFKERFQLCTEKAIYSYEDKYDNFRTAFDQLRIGEKKVNNTLLLGLGLGSIPFMLETIYQVDTDYIAVEIDEVICQLADKYVLSDLKSSIQTFPIDAMDYFKWYDHRFDMIAMDIFQSAEIPDEFESIDYLETMNTRLNEGGILLYNRLANTALDKERNEIFSQNWTSVFPNGGIIDCKNNVIFINDLRLIPQ